MPKLERRSFHVEFRAEGGDGDEPKRWVGYAAVFDEVTELFEGFKEVVRQGAFTKTLREADVRALWNHDDNNVLGRTKSGTLQLSEDDHGLKVEITPPKSAERESEAIERGDVDQMSFAFSVMKDTLEREDDGTTMRELIELRLFDVSPVTWPAYPTTEISARGTHRDDLDELRERVKALDAKEGEPVPADHSRMARHRRRLQMIEIS